MKIVQHDSYTWISKEHQFLLYNQPPHITCNSIQHDFSHCTRNHVVQGFDCILLYKSSKHLIQVPSCVPGWLLWLPWPAGQSGCLMLPEAWTLVIMVWYYQIEFSSNHHFINLKVIPKKKTEKKKKQIIKQLQN